MEYNLRADRYVIDESWDGNQEALITLTRTDTTNAESVDLTIGGSASYGEYLTSVQIHSASGSVTVSAPPGFDNAEGVLRHPDGSQFIVFYKYESDTLSTDAGYTYALTKIGSDGLTDTGFGDGGTWYASAPASSSIGHRFVLNDAATAIVVPENNLLGAISTTDASPVSIPGLSNPGSLLYIDETLSIQEEAGDLVAYAHGSTTALWTVTPNMFYSHGSATNAKDSFSWSSSPDLFVTSGVAYFVSSSVDGSISMVDAIRIDSGASDMSIDGVFVEPGIVVAPNAQFAQIFNSASGLWENLALSADGSSLATLPTDEILSAAGSSIYFKDPAVTDSGVVGVYKVDVSASGTMSLDASFGESGYAVWPSDSYAYAGIAQALEVGRESSQYVSDFGVSGASTYDGQIHFDFDAGQADASFSISAWSADGFVDDQETLTLVAVDQDQTTLSNQISLTIVDDGQNDLGTRAFDLNVGEAGVMDRETSPYESWWSYHDNTLGEEITRIGRQHFWNADNTYDSVDAIRMTFAPEAGGADALAFGGLEFAFGAGVHEYTADGTQVNSSKNADITDPEQFSVTDGTDYFVLDVGLDPITFEVTAAGGKYLIDGILQDSPTLIPGQTYIFDYSTATGHPLKLSTTPDGTHGQGAAYTDGVTELSGDRLQLEVTESTPDLHYFCTAHAGMGSSVSISDAGAEVFYFGASYEDEYHLMSVGQSLSDGGDYVFDLAVVDGSQMSGSFVNGLMNELGLDYGDHVMAGTVRHYSEVHGSVDLLVDGLWVSESEPASVIENEFVFIYDNMPYEAYAATHHGSLIEVYFGNEKNFGDLNDDADVDPNLFTITVDGSTSTHSVVDVMVDNSVLLFLDGAIAAGSTVSVEYADPAGEQFGGILEAYSGVDATSTASPLISQAMDSMGFDSSNFKFYVGDGAVLGWNSMEEEDFYTNDADWHNLGVTVLNSDEANDRMTLEIHPTGWINNPHYDPAAETGLTSQPYLSLKVEAVFSFDAGVVDGSVTDLLEIINIQNLDLLVHEWKGYALTSDAADGASSQEHHLYTYEVGNGGAPAIQALASGFGFGSTTFGSDYSDTLGSPLSLTDSVVNAGHGNDFILNGVFADTYANGEMGDDTLTVFKGVESDFTISKTGSNTFTLGALDGSVTSYLTSIEHVQFEDGFVLDLDSVDPVGGHSVTTLGGSGTETAALFNGYDYVDLTAVSAGLDSYFVLDLGVPDGVDELSTLGTDQTGSYGLSGFEGFIVAGSAVSQLGTDTQIDIFTSPDANDSVVIAEGSGLSIDLGVESDWDILSFRGTDAAVDITLTDKTSYVTFEAFGGNSEVLGADAVLGSEAGDTITGYASSTNALAGSAGDDTITGGNEADALVGGDGDDTLIGGAGNDLLVDLDGNTTGSLIGGDGRDLYYVRGDETSAAHISGFGVAEDGLARGSLSSNLYNDRIAFSISSSALATIAALSQADTVNWPPSPTATEIAEYLQLRDLISLDVTNASGDGQNWELTATVNHLDAEGASVSTLLGRATFSTDKSYTIDADGVGSTLKTKVLEWDDGLDSFLDTIAQAVQDHVEFDDHALNITAGTQGGTDGFTTDVVELVVGIYADDAQRVELQDGAPPILLPVIVNGQEVAARFQPVDADEKIVGGRAGDSYEFVGSTFIDDATDQPLADQSFGTDLVIERGLRGDTTQRDTLEFAEYTDPGNTEVGSGLSINDLLVGDLVLTRTEIGSEGAGRSLEVTYSGTELNHVDVGLYKQYYEYSDSFRVEDLQLLDGDAVGSLVRQYDLGVTGADGNLSTTDGRDAVLVGRTGVVDTMTVTQGTSSETSIDIILDDFEVTDKVDLTDFGDIANAGADITFGADSVSVTMDLANADATDDVTLNFYFTGATPDETEFLVLTASG